MYTVQVDPHTSTVAVRLRFTPGTTIDNDATGSWLRKKILEKYIIYFKWW